MALFANPYLFTLVMAVAAGIAVYEFLQMRKPQKTHSRRRSPRDSSSYPETWSRDSSANHVSRPRPSSNPSSISSTPYNDFQKSERVKRSESNANTTNAAEVKQNTSDSGKERIFKSEEIKTEIAAGKQNICDSDREISGENACILSLKTEEKPNGTVLSNSEEFFNEPLKLVSSKKSALESPPNNEYTSESQLSNESTSEFESSEGHVSESQPSKENVTELPSCKVCVSETEFCEEDVLEQHDVTRVTTVPKQQEKETSVQLDLVKQKNSLCNCCGKYPVSTIVLPCKHQYTCSECAPYLFQFYDNCVVCRKKIDSYESV